MKVDEEDAHSSTSSDMSNSTSSLDVEILGRDWIRRDDVSTTVRNILSGMSFSLFFYHLVYWILESTEPFLGFVHALVIFLTDITGHTLLHQIAHTF